MRAKRVVVLSLSSAFGLGYAPVAPGTFGTLAAVPLWWLMASLPLAYAIGLVVVAIALSVWVSSQAEAIYGKHDVGHIVIDEVVGLLVTGLGVPFAWPEVLAGFVLFRLLDITKPPPIRWLDDNVKGGLGVVVDDVAAGVVACLILHVARFLLGGWW